LNISSTFDSGNIVVQSIEGRVANLEIARDQHCHYFQWFYFRVAGVFGQKITLKINNAGASSFPNGWSGYRARYSTDRIHWRQESNTQFVNGVLSIEHQCETEVIWFAYFAPFTIEQHHQLIADTLQRPGVFHAELGKSLEGRSIDYLQIGSQDPDAKQVWLFARQHPGETMAQWWVKGALEMLTKPVHQLDAALVQQLLAQCRFHVVPNMNPDGSARGHLRTNALGVDLNRQWQNPSLEKSPEVFYVWQQMLKTGVHLAMDIHGDETIPANFFAGFKGVPNLRDDKWAVFKQFQTQLATEYPDFQDKLGYPEGAAGQANLALATNAIAHHFGCVALTLEMPFKDHDINPQPEFGWSPERCQGLAHACLRTIARLVECL
jgi:murein tripeptide amidase MpaA